MGKHLEQALPSVYTFQYLTVDNNNNISYVGGLPKVGSERGVWLKSDLRIKSRWGWLFFSPSRYLSHFTLGYLAQRFSLRLLGYG